MRPTAHHWIVWSCMLHLTDLRSDLSSPPMVKVLVLGWLTDPRSLCMLLYHAHPLPLKPLWALIFTLWTLSCTPLQWKKNMVSSTVPRGEPCEAPNSGRGDQGELEGGWGYCMLAQIIKRRKVFWMFFSLFCFRFLPPLYPHCNLLHCCALCSMEFRSTSWNPGKAVSSWCAFVLGRARCSQPRLSAQESRRLARLLHSDSMPE